MQLLHFFCLIMQLLQRKEKKKTIIIKGTVHMNMETVILLFCGAHRQDYNPHSSKKELHN